MLSVAERALGLNGTELRRAFPIFLYLFLTMASSVASKAARDALFLDRYRAIDLPYVDIAIAALVGLAAGLYIWFGHRTNLRNLQVGSLIVFALSALLFWWWAAVAEQESGPRFDRTVTIEERIGAATRLLGSSLNDREEAIEVMAISLDPWLRACAAYATGEMRLKRFAPMLDAWAEDPEALLRATAIAAREKLRHAVAADAGVEAL